MDKIYRIFISSCKRLLEKERQMLSEFILMNNHLPVQMEYSFQSDNRKYSIEVDKKRLEEADCVICILSYLYGEIIEEKIGNKEECPLREKKHKNCDLCLGPKGCKLSFTQFEYEYAKLLDKPIIVIFNKNYNLEEAFTKANQIYREQYKGEDCKKAYYGLQEKNDVFISDVKLKHSYPYSSHEDFIKACALAVESAIKLLDERENSGNINQGLIPYTYFAEIDREAKIINKLLQEVKENGVEKIYSSQSVALEELAEEKNIYLGLDGNIQTIRILAIRDLGQKHMNL